MIFDPRIHSLPQLAKSILGQVEKMTGGMNYENDELLVLNYHNTPKKFIAQFREQVNFLVEHFNVISPASLNEYFSGTYKADKCSLLFTFDDGLKNNEYAVEVLEEKNIKALFFVVPDFIDTPFIEQKEFYLRNIRPIVNGRIDEQEEDFSALSWKDLKRLIAQGHTVGAHTLTHTLVAQNSTQANSEKEILQSKKIIEDKLQVSIDCFCSINDTLLSTGKKEKTLIEKNFSFHFTTLPGCNAVKKDPQFIKRRNVECYWPTGAFYYALGQADLKRWENKIEQYENL